MRGAAAVVEAISIIGPRNVSALARRTSLPVETVRYLLRRRFPRIGLQPQLYVDYKRLGLVSLVTELIFPAKLQERAPSILNVLAEHAYLTYYAEFADCYGYTAMFAAPVTRRTEVEDFLRELMAQGILVSAKHELLSWSRRVSVDPAYLDLRSGRWRINWSDLPNRPYVEPSLSVHPQTDPHVDSTDLLILKELQKDATRPMARISRNLDVSRRVLQYHYQHHLGTLAADYYVGWVGRQTDRPQTVRLHFQFSQLTGPDVRQVRLAFNRLPFPIWEGGNDSGFYTAWASIPQTELVPSLNFIKTTIGDLTQTMSLRIINSAKIAAYTIPDQLFDSGTGWQFRAQKLLRTLSPLVPTLNKKRGAEGAS